MTESEFIKRNQADWKNFEESLDNASVQADQLSRLFSKVSADLSYAQTHYPRRGIRRYLNQLLGDVFNKMMVKPRLDFRKTISTFYTDTVAAVILKHKYAFIMSFVLFFLAVLAGTYSTLVHEDFPLTILGPEYMATTEANIKANDPMAIYKSSPSSVMFLAITFNNIKVAFLAYVMGVFAMLGTFYILIRNGIMLGTFQTFFYTKGLLFTSFLTIWIHGTIEISSILIAGAAGIILGKSIVHPGTFTRSQSIKLGALESFIVVISTIPLFILAGFLEGFVTRQTELPDLFKLGIIFLSLMFVIFIYVYLPYQYAKRASKHKAAQNFIIHQAQTESSDKDEFIIIQAFKNIRRSFETILYYILFPAFCLLIPVLVYEVRQDKVEFGLLDGSSHLQDLSFIMYFGIFLLCFILLSTLYAQGENFSLTRKSWWENMRRYFPVYVVSSLILSYPLILGPSWILFFVLLALPFFLGYIILFSIKDSKNIYEAMNSGFQFTYQHWPHMMLYTFVAILVYLILEFFITMIRWLFLDDMILWHDLFSNSHQNMVFVELLIRNMIQVLYLVFLYFLAKEFFQKTYNRKYSADLKDQVEHIIHQHQKNH